MDCFLWEAVGEDDGRGYIVLSSLSVNFRLWSGGREWKVILNRWVLKILSLYFALWEFSLWGFHRPGIIEMK